MCTKSEICKLALYSFDIHTAISDYFVCTVMCDCGRRWDQSYCSWLAIGLPACLPDCLAMCCVAAVAFCCYRCCWLPHWCYALLLSACCQSSTRVFIMCVRVRAYKGHVCMRFETLLSSLPTPAPTQARISLLDDYVCPLSSAATATNLI